MYKMLMGTAAAALLVSPAVAGPMGITVGGYYNAVVYSQDVDASAKRDLGIHNDTEIVFKGKGKTKGSPHQDTKGKGKGKGQYGKSRFGKGLNEVGLDPW